MRDRIDKIYKLALQKIEVWRLKIATHPRVILWRLKLFGIHPFFGKHALKIAGIISVCILVFGIMYVSFWRAPRPFPDQALITIERGETLSQIADSFKQSRVVRSVFWLKIFIFLNGGEKHIIAGDYYFPDAVSVFTVARKLNKGEFGLIAIKVTIPEGENSFDIAEILDKQLPAFNAQDFVDEVQKNNYEGYLFPDTYFFTPNTKADEVILTMRENFARQIKQYENDIASSTRSLNDIVIVASIIEDEANSDIANKRIVSGILWKRLSKDMPLQVDSAFQYYNGKNTFTLTTADLKDDENPYNTYVHKGLPPTAICNPGLDSLRAAIAPTNTDYLFFLSDKHGNMHYARTFEEHKANKEKYLN